MILPSPLCVICDAEVCARAGWSLVEFAAACLHGGARFLQVRAKQASSGQLLDAAAAIVEAATPASASVIVNDRADVARLAGAAGVHVGQDDLAPAAVRAVLGDRAVVGLSTHTSDQVAAGIRQPVTYIAIGPIFPTSTKVTGYDSLGLTRVREAAALARSRELPLVAIGGITLERALDVIDSGAQAVAVTSDLLVGGNPALRVKAFLDRLSGSDSGTRTPFHIPV